MPKLRIDILQGRPLLDIASYAKRGPARRDHLAATELALISRTVRQAPEVVLKVLSKGSTDLKSVGRHFGYIGRYGELGVETDEGEQLKGEAIGRDLSEDWDLDLDEHRRSADLCAALGRQPLKLVHKLMFSMPAGTPAEAVRAAAENFLREEFALKHRYAFVLHTDEPHPHVHAVIKAVSEQGKRLHIRKATLRGWREDFARHLRAQGIDANATDRAVRGQSRAPKGDAVYRAMRRGDSSHVRSRVDEVLAELAKGEIRLEAEKTKLLRTRKEVVDGWRAVDLILTQEGRHELAVEVQRFIGQLQPARTEKEWLVAELLGRVRAERSRDNSPMR